MWIPPEAVVAFVGLGLLARAGVAQEEDGPVPSPPDCLSAAFELRPDTVRVSSGSAELLVQLFRPPEGTGPFPAVVTLHGGGDDSRPINAAPEHVARSFARCGFVAAVHDKRGLLGSTGSFTASTLDDLVADAGAVVGLLVGLQEVDGSRIGVVGASQGGRLAPVVAVRHPEVAWAVSVSGPFTSLARTRRYAVERSYLRAGIQPDSVETLLEGWEERFHRPNPFFNSLGRDYTAELQELEVPLLAIWGELDATVPVEASLAALRSAVPRERHHLLDLRVVPGVGHSFMPPGGGDPYPWIDEVVAWALDRGSG